MTTKLSNCLNPVSRLPGKDHVRFCLDTRGQTVTKDRMIFDNRDADLFGGRHCEHLNTYRFNGSAGKTRTYNPPVNSRMLCH